MKIGRNDPCPCGSGKKFKYCHINKNFNFDSNLNNTLNINQYTLYERNLILIGAISEIFGFNKGKNLDDFKSTISSEQIKELYKLIAYLWHYNTKIENILPEPSTELRALYLGDVQPESVIQNIIRYSLYTDKIYIINPFINPWCVRDDFNPIKNPDKYKLDTIKLVIFMCLLEPWIRTKLIELIPDPGDFNYNLRINTYKLAEERLKGWKPTKEELEEFEPEGRNFFERFFYSLPEDYIMQMMKSHNPVLNEQELKDIIDYIKIKRKQDLIGLDQTFDKNNIPGQFGILRTGVNLEMAFYICQITGAYPYTNMKKRWEEILSARNDLSETGKIWSPLTKAFQSLDFKFLNNVDPKFAIKIKEEGRLEAFRTYLRKIWNTVGGEPENDKIDSLVRDFKDELTYEYNKSKADWQKINFDLIKWAGSSLSASIISGGLNFEIPAIGFGLTTVTQLITSYYKKNTFRKTVPLSVLIDLSKHKRK